MLNWWQKIVARYKMKQWEKQDFYCTIRGGWPSIKYRGCTLATINSTTNRPMSFRLMLVKK